MVKLNLKNATLTVPVVGDGGYANQSTLLLDVVGIGKINVGDPWDLTFIDGKVIQGLELSIPSGALKFLGNISVSLEAEEDGFQNLVFRTQEARWDGKQNGFFGGMSAYGQFRAEIESVVEGTYMLPEDYRAWNHRDRPVIPMQFSTDWPYQYRVDWEIYRRRQRAVEASNLEQALTVAAGAARLLAKPAKDRTEPEANALIQWHDYIRQEVESLEGVDTYETAEEAIAQMG